MIHVLFHAHTWFVNVHLPALWRPIPFGAHAGIPRGGL